MTSFKGSQLPKTVILYAVFFYLRYGVSYRNLEEILLERGVDVDHATFNRWMVKYSPLISNQARRRKTAMSNSWRDEDAATTFFKKTIKTNGIPEMIVIDKSGAKYAGIKNFNILFLLSGFYHLIDILQVKYLNRITGL